METTFFFRKYKFEEIIFFKIVNVSTDLLITSGVQMEHKGYIISFPF